MAGAADRYIAPIEDDGMRHWRVAGGVIVTADGVLLVKNQRRGGSVDWTTPGGVIDPGETATEALTREVQEETGLAVAGWHGPLYRVEVVAPDVGFRLGVEAHLAGAVSGELVLDDPDGIVIDAAFVDPTAVGPYFDGAPPWVSEPLLAHLQSGIDDGRLFRYRMLGGHEPGVPRKVERL